MKQNVHKAVNISNSTVGLSILKTGNNERKQKSTLGWYDISCM